MNAITVNWHGFKLNLHSASIHHLADVDPELQWHVRGISGHDRADKKDQEKLQIQKQRAINRLLSESTYQNKLQNFVSEVSQVMQGLFTRSNTFLTNYMGRRNYKFVMGAMRTGGTYLYKELCEIYGQEWDKLNMEMTHDSIPTYSVLSNSHSLNMQLVFAFEMAQFLVWAKHEIESDIIIQKRIAYAHALPAMHGLFNDQAEYILTIRHPITLGYSFAKLGNQNALDEHCKEPPGWYDFVVDGGRDISRKEWNDFRYLQKVLYYWERYYLDAAEAGPFQQNLSTVVFGDDVTRYLQSIKEKTGSTYELEAFNAKESELQDEIDQFELEEIFNNVQQRWLAQNLTFPSVPAK